MYIGVSAQLAVNSSAQEVKASVLEGVHRTTLKAGSSTQQILQKTGDDVRIDWGHLYVSFPSDKIAWKQDISSSGPNIRESPGLGGRWPSDPRRPVPRSDIFPGRAGPP